MADNMGLKGFVAAVLAIRTALMRIAVRVLVHMEAHARMESMTVISMQEVEAQKTTQGTMAHRTSDMAR